MRWIQLVVDFGAVVGLSTTLLIGLYSQARIYLAIGRDGLLPAAFGEISDRSGAPVAAQLLCGALALGMAAVLDVHHLASILSIGGPWASPAWLASSRLASPLRVCSSDRHRPAGILAAYSVVCAAALTVANAPSSDARGVDMPSGALLAALCGTWTAGAPMADLTWGSLGGTLADALLFAHCSGCCWAL
jgi:hypothetical protein